VKDLLNVLKQTGYDVSSTSNSKEAIEIAKNYKPDLLIVNITDPDTSVYDFIDFIKTSAELKDIPMIALTDKELTDEQKDALNGRIKEIINKSLFSEEQLITELKNSLKKIGGIS